MVACGLTLTVSATVSCQTFEILVSGHSQCECDCIAVTVTRPTSLSSTLDDSATRIPLPPALGVSRSTVRSSYAYASPFVSSLSPPWRSPSCFTACPLVVPSCWTCATSCGPRSCSSASHTRRRAHARYSLPPASHTLHSSCTSASCSSSLPSPLRRLCRCAASTVAPSPAVPSQSTSHRQPHRKTRRHRHLWPHCDVFAAYRHSFSSKRRAVLTRWAASDY